tara:strand:- start:20 stop:1894 length:1875 start_codon:yes stop_codon:yes gene_type:complete
MSESPSTRDWPPPVRWLPSLDPGPNDWPEDADPEEGALVLPVFPAQRLYFPFLRINLDIFGSSPKHRTMYDDILFSGARRFAVVKVDPRQKRLSEVGVVFYLDELKSKTPVSRAAGVHRVIGRVKLNKVLNPKSVKTQDSYLKAQCEFLADSDPHVDTTKEEQRVEELLRDVVAAQAAIEEIPRLHAKTLVDPFEGSTGKVDFSRGSGGVWDVMDPNLTSRGMGLWGAILIWQQFLEGRTNWIASRMRVDIGKLVDKFYNDRGKEPPGKAVSGGYLEVNFDQLPTDLQEEIRSIQIRYGEDAKASDPGSDWMQAMLQTDEHATRLRLFRESLEQERNRLSARSAIRSLLKDCGQRRRLRGADGDAARGGSTGDGARRMVLVRGGGVDTLYERLTLLGGADRVGEFAPSAVVEEEVWHEEWSTRFECWWGGLPFPTQNQLGSCLGALSLHLGSRLSLLVGQTPGQTPGQTLAPTISEPGCEWFEQAVSELELPEFPELNFEFTVPPIPRLVPSREFLHSLRFGGGVLSKAHEPSHILHAPAPRVADSAATDGENGLENGVLHRSSSWLAAGAVGSGVGAGVALLSVALVSRSIRRRGGRTAIRSKPPPHECRTWDQVWRRFGLYL